jgi:hypothetical protein
MNLEGKTDSAPFKGVAKDCSGLRAKKRTEHFSIPARSSGFRQLGKGRKPLAMNAAYLFRRKRPQLGRIDQGSLHFFAPTELIEPLNCELNVGL